MIRLSNVPELVLKDISLFTVKVLCITVLLQNFKFAATWLWCKYSAYYFKIIWKYQEKFIWDIVFQMCPYNQ